MNYYPEQTIDNINSILKHQLKTFAEMALDLREDPIMFQQEIFEGKISIEKLGSISAYLNMPIEALFSDTLQMNMDSDTKHEKRELEDDRKLFSAFILSALIPDANKGQLGIDIICKKAVEWADGLIDVLKEKKK